MRGEGQSGQANLMAILIVVGVIVSAVWVWKRLSLDTQDYVVEHIIPLAVVFVLAVIGCWRLIGRVRRRRQQRQRRERLMRTFEKESSSDKRRDLAFLLIEVNEYRLEGLETIASALADVFIETLQTALGDKQHRIRGMAASHLGVLQEKRAVPFLIKALDDDHAYVRASAALGLGRMRAVEAREKLAYMAKEDWDQTVRSRAREALERL
jgi:hypothetical protein